MTESDREFQVTLSLTRAEAEMLSQTISCYWDEGPSNEGWQSDRMSRLAAKIADAVESALSS
jgi:hypothetical protein